MEGQRIAAVTTVIVVFLGFLTSSGEYRKCSCTEKGVWSPSTCHQRSPSAITAGVDQVDHFF